MTITRRGVLQPLSRMVPQMPRYDPGSSRGTADGGLGGAPMAFSAQLDMTAGQLGVPLDLSSLQPGFRTAYWIDEIRIAVTSSLVSASALEQGCLAAIRARFQTGIHPLMARPVPIGVLAPRFSRWDESNAIVGSSAPGTPTYNAYGHVRWVLPRPLYMAPGDALQCNLDRDLHLMAAITTLSVTVTYVGRAIAQGAESPRVRHVPWTAFFEKKSSEAQVTSTIATGSWAGPQFRNPFMRPLQVQRLTSRSYDVTSNVSNANLQVQESQDRDQVPGSYTGQPTTYERVFIEDSNGYKITGKQEVPMGALFDLSKRAWTFARPIGAREQLDVRVWNALPSTDAHFYVQHYFGLVASREEDV